MGHFRAVSKKYYIFKFISISTALNIFEYLYLMALQGHSMFGTFKVTKLMYVNELRSASTDWID